MGGIRPQLVKVMACVGVLMLGLDNLILNLALPALASDVGASSSDLQWIVDAYVLLLAGLLLVSGTLGDRFGPARMLRVGLTIFGLASGVAALSDGVLSLVVCRGVMGIGASLILPSSVAILARTFVDPRERTRAFALFSVFAGLGIALGPILGGVLLAHFSWASVFWINVPIAAAVLVVAWITVPTEHEPHATPFDVIGTVLAVLGIGGLVYATIDAPVHGWLELRTLLAFAIAAILVVSFVAWELHCAHPMFEITLFRARQFSAATVSNSVVNLAFAALLFMLSQFLQAVLGHSALEAGLRLLPMAIVFMVGGWISAPLTERIGTKLCVASGTFAVAAGMLMLAFVDVSTPYLVLAMAMALSGLGQGMVVAPVTTAIVAAAPRRSAGAATGMLSTLRQIGTALGIAVIGSILVSVYRDDLSAATTDLTPEDRETARSSISAAVGVARRIGGSAGATLERSADDAFVRGFQVGSAVTAAISVVAALVVLAYVPSRTVISDDVDASAATPAAPRSDHAETR